MESDSDSKDQPGFLPYSVVPGDYSDRSSVNWSWAGVGDSRRISNGVVRSGLAIRTGWADLSFHTALLPDAVNPGIECFQLE